MGRAVGALAITAAVLERLLHRSVIVNGDSYRIKHREAFAMVSSHFS